MTSRIAVRTADQADLAAARRIAAGALAYDADGADVVDLLWTAAATPAELRVVAEWDGQVVGVGLGSLGVAGVSDVDPAAAARRGHVNLLAVVPAEQGRGIGSALLSAVEDRLRRAGATLLVIRGSAPEYAWPGIDIRYTTALCLAESRGYRRTGEGLNMTVELDSAPLDTAEDESRLAATGITVRCARPDDEAALLEWVRTFGGTWYEEAATALRHSPTGCHVATSGARFVGFACQGVNRRAWFGPMATDESMRGRGVGAVLLRRCLADQRAAGLHRAEIGWTGPVRFYARSVGATLDRVFWLYEKRA